MTITIHKPAGWEHDPLDDLMQLDAGQAYVLQQFDAEDAVTPDHVFKRSGSGDYCCYEVYEDGSLWYVNNAEDEVWPDYSDFVREQLIPGLLASKEGDSRMFWTEEEAEQSGDMYSYAPDEMDRQLLMLAYDDDESEIREILGL